MLSQKLHYCSTFDADYDLKTITIFQILPTGVDITIVYGNPIIATDTDYNFGEQNYNGAIIQFEVQVNAYIWYYTQCMYQLVPGTT